jgi:hypothetical protein
MSRHTDEIKNPADLESMIPTAKAAMQRLADMEGEKAARAAIHGKDADAAKHELIERLRKPSGLTREERMALAARVIERAVNRGVTEVEVYRFPHELCTDNGRAINQAEAGWETTLTGIPREIYELWREHLQPRGYKIRYQIVDYPGGMPGEVGVTLSWH